MTGSRLSQRNTPIVSLCSSSKKDMSTNVLSANSNMNMISYKDIEIKKDMDQLDISPEELTITELNNPEEETLGNSGKSSSVVISSMGANSVNHTLETKKVYQPKLAPKPVDKVRIP